MFFNTNDMLPLILSTTLSEEQVEAFLKVMKKRKKALDPHMADKHGINPDLCIQKIFMEEGNKLSLQPQFI